MKQWLDFSFGAANVTAAWAAARVAEGVDGVMACLWTGRESPAGAETALRLCREAGLTIAGYVAVHGERPIEEHIERGIAAAGAEWPRMAVVVQDVEPIPGVQPVTAGALRTGADLVVANGQRTGIYTGVGAWGECMRGMAVCPDLPLIDASWGQTPGLDCKPPYSGWTRRAAHQYANDVEIDGVLCDRLLVDDAFALPGPTPEAEWSNALDVLGGWGRRLPQLADQVGASTPEAGVAGMLREAGKEISDVAGIVARLRGAKT